MVCGQCGHPNPDGARTCGRCASGLPDPDVTRAAASPSPPPVGSTVPARAEAGEPAPGATNLGEGSRFGSRYRVVRLLGRGGMGAVYLARDLELDRDVALKLIAPHLAAEPGLLDRFRREVQLSSLVTHPNVLRVYDLGEVGGQRFLTMQYIEGRSLAEILRDERPLAVERAVALFRQICDGLAAAHEKGVLHRDLKPQNVMVDGDGRAYLADFGLATSAAVATMTGTGAVLGTPHYMSPEQVKGQDVDARSDVFGLGVVLYEMLAGVLPYGGETAFEVMIRRTRSPPRPVREVNPRVPVQLQKLLDRCLAIDPKLRYASARELLADLDAGTVRTSLAYLARRRWRPALAVAAGLALAFGGWAGWRAWRSRPSPQQGTEAAAEVPMVGVVPLVNLTGDERLDWVGAGVARLVGDGLAVSRHVRVASAQRIGELRRASADDAALLRRAGEIGLTHVVTGELLARPGGFTVSCRVTDVRTGQEVTSRRVDAGSRSDVLSASNDVALAVRRGLRIPLAEGLDTYAADFATHNAEAYEAYGRGLDAYARYRYAEAEGNLREALRLAPDFAMARFRLAWVLADTSRGEEALREVRSAVAEASRLGDREARYVRAAEANLSQRTDDATRQYEELIARYPYDLEPRQYLAQLHLGLGDWQRALAQGRAMTQIDPRSPTARAVLGSAYLGLRDFNQALAEFRRYAELDPGSPNAHHLLADCYRAQGAFDLAAEQYRAALGIDPAFHFSTLALAQVEALRGRHAEAETLLRPLAAAEGELPRFRNDAAFDLASSLRAQGRFREAGAILLQVERPIRAEAVREAMALSTRAQCEMELGNLRRAEDLARKAVARSPGTVATRYLLALATVQLRQGRIADARATAASILEKAAPPSDPDRAEEKAAAYVSGLASLREGRVGPARQDLERAVGLPGYEYSLYRLALAEAHLAAGRHAEALANVKQAEAPPDPVAPRLDLELDRVRARLVEARVAAAMGRVEEASTSAASFLAAWSRADPGLPELAEARRIARR